MDMGAELWAEGVDTFANENYCCKQMYHSALQS